MKDTSEQIKDPLRVIHLEDNPADAELIVRVLQERKIPCSITRISAQREFEEALQNDQIDLILSDCDIPGFNTLSALTLVRETCPAIPFVFVSGTASPSIKADAIHCGAADFISKDDLPKLAHAIELLFFPNERQHGSCECGEKLSIAASTFAGENRQTC